MEKELGVILARLQGLAQTGLAYTKDPYDRERYEELQELTKKLIRRMYPEITEEQLRIYMEKDEGYATPKVDIRAAVFNQADRLLLVQEKSDGCWALPGGWADIGYSPMEIAEKEVLEEAGIKVSANRLIAVQDKAKHPYPPSLTYTYKFFIACTFLTGMLSGGLETSAAEFFTLAEALELPLSEERNTRKDIVMLFTDHLNPKVRQVACD